MKAILALLVAAPVALSYADEPDRPLALDMPSYQEPAREWRSVESADGSSETCRDTIRHVREENGQPALRKDTADPEQPLLIAAVDHRIDGCNVMVMRNDVSDVRPIPAAPEGPAKLIPAR